ncbi:solute carrier family 15 member 2-like [Daphnia pulicaria]|uniref:solute carrier family 15 member 2-like n=1 Tax=Daphnia pulicaria TaxID=35523 RepID=UPI001EEAC727|nr:solute carrier family 15 member 2-like [Daphnia pulicaria]
MSRKSSSSSSDSEVSVEKVVPPLHDESTTSHPTPEKPLDVEQPDKNVKLKYPKSVFCIIVNEFCERFNFYGMRTVLTLYMSQILNFSEDKATIFYHSFLMLSYFSPIPGSILADTYLGKFKTIAILSIFYAFGSIILAVAAIPNFLPQIGFSMTGLLIIAIGTGGIKPCVSAFGGDQFVRPQQDRQLESFFSVFYFSVNAGSLISTAVTPILREDVSCFGDDTCYPLAFGVPAVLMLISVVIFLAGKPLYTIKKPQGNIMGEFFKCIGHAISRKWKAKGEKHDHWLDFASDKFDKQLIEDVKRVLSVGFVFIPLPVFWALYDQQGSRWTFQATRMNGDLGGVVIKPDQMQIVNPLLILILVPIFETVIYPCFKKSGLLTPLRRIGCGLVLCGLSFVVSGFVEIALEPTYATIPGDGRMQLNFINTLPCNVSVVYGVSEKNGNFELQGNMYEFVQDLEAEKDIIVRAFLDKPDCAGYTQFVNIDTGIVSLGTGDGTQGYSILITEREKNLTITRLNKEEQLEKSNTGDPYVAFFLDDRTFEEYSGWNITMLQKIKKKTFEYVYVLNDTAPTTPTVDSIVQTDYQKTEIGSYELFLNGENIGNLENLIQGGVYRVVIQKALNGSNYYDIMTVQVTPPNTVGILWLLPQYFVVTFGEVMFSVTGLSFSYSQAPISMKSVMTAIWLMVVAFGNLIDIIVIAVQSGATGEGMSQASEFFMFAGIMGIAVILFTLMSWNYKYVEEIKIEDEKKRLSAVPSHKSDSSSSSSSSDSDDEKGKENKGFSE